MNTITISKTKNIGNFEPPKSQDLYFILKSLLLFKDEGLPVTNEDIFTWDKEEDIYLLLHFSASYQEEKVILAVKHSDIKTMNTRTLHKNIISAIHHAWIEKLI